mgnify:CR=1 FL=1
MNTATSIEQSRRLLDAGVPDGSADLWMVQEGGFISPYLTTNPRLGNQIGKHAIRVWSLSALWQIVNHLGGAYEFDTTMRPEDIIELLVCAIIEKTKK